MISKRSRSYKTSANFLAGWMFADLLLALSVIFLATISFQSEKIISTSPNALTRQDDVVRNISTTNSDAQSLKSTRKDSGSLQDGLTLEYSKFDPLVIKSDIDEYLLENYASLEYEVIYIQAIGGYKASEEPSNKGSLAAMRFVVDLRKNEVEYVKRAAIDLSTSPNIESGNVVLRLVFVKRI